MQRPTPTLLHAPCDAPSSRPARTAGTLSRCLYSSRTPTTPATTTAHACDLLAPGVAAAIEQGWPRQRQQQHQAWPFQRLFDVPLLASSDSMASRLHKALCTTRLTSCKPDRSLPCMHTVGPSWHDWPRAMSCGTSGAWPKMPVKAVASPPQGQATVMNPRSEPGPTSALVPQLYLAPSTRSSTAAYCLCGKQSAVVESSILPTHDGTKDYRLNSYATQ